MKSSKITYIALFSALSIIFGYIESLFPLPIAIPGIKLGLSNIVILFALIKLGKANAFLIMLIKVTVCSLLFSGFNSFIYSLSGGILSVLAMIILIKFNFNIITASIAGGIFHNVGQIISSAIVLQSTSALYYLPILLFSGIIVGFVTGTLTKTIISRIK